MKSGHPVSNEEERVEHISKRNVEEKIWIKEDWNRKITRGGSWFVLFVWSSYVFKTSGPCDGNRKNGKCIQVILMGKLI
jgi:hypothetical protein